MSDPKDQSRGDWQKLHLWQIQPVRDVLVLASILAILWLGYILSIVTVPILLALTLAYLFEPLVQRLLRVRWISRQGAASGIIAVCAVAVVLPVTLGVGFAAFQGVTFTRKLVGNVKSVVEYGSAPSEEALAQMPNDFWRFACKYYDEHKEELSQSGAFVRAQTWLEGNTEDIVGQAFKTGFGAVEAIINTVASVGFLLFIGFLTAFFFFFFCTGYGKVLDFWESLLPDKKKGVYVDLAKQMDKVIAGFVRGRLTIAAIQSVFFVIAYWIIGVPAPLLLGPLVGILSIVPYVALIGIPISIVLMGLDASGETWQAMWWWFLIAPTAVYVLGQALDDYLLTPMIQGKSTDMDTPSILFASIAGGALAGIYGLLLAIPVAACSKILLRELFWPKFKAWAKGEEEDFLPIDRD